MTEVEEAKSSVGTFRCIRTHNDISVLLVGEKELCRDLRGTHKYNKELAQAHFDIWGD